ALPAAWAPSTPARRLRNHRGNGLRKTISTAEAISSPPGPGGTSSRQSRNVWPARRFAAWGAMTARERGSTATWASLSATGPPERPGQVPRRPGPQGRTREPAPAAAPREPAGATVTGRPHPAFVSFAEPEGWNRAE